MNYGLRFMTLYRLKCEQISFFLTWLRNGWIIFSKGTLKYVKGKQCKEIEGNNTMGKTRDLFKKIRDTKGTFHTKMGLIEERNGMDLTEAEDIKKRWQ